MARSSLLVFGTALVLLMGASSGQSAGAGATHSLRSSTRKLQDGALTCSNGVLGVQNEKATACCVAECGACGGPGCSSFGPADLDLGSDDCCVVPIENGGAACSETGAAPCFMDDLPTPAPAPVVASEPCDNGVDGVMDKDVCCAAGCVQCGGPGCSTIGAPELGAFDCCYTEIRNFGDSCSITGEAPCYMGDPANPGPAPFAPVNPEDTSFSFSFSFDFDYDEFENAFALNVFNEAWP